jgi:hypothetical protein
MNRNLDKKTSYRRRESGSRSLYVDPKQHRGLRAYLRDLQDEILFNAGLEIDPRDKVSYPDTAQASDRLIYVVLDSDRQDVGEILLDVFSEEGLLEG